MRCLLGWDDHRSHLHAGVQAVADHPAGGRIADRFGELVARFADRDRQGDRQAALPGAAEGAVGDDLHCHLHVGIRQDDDRVLGPALGLGALAVGGRAAVDVPGYRRRADKADRPDGGMVQDGIHRLLGAVDQVEHALGQPDLLDQLEDLLHRQWALSRTA